MKHVISGLICIFSLCWAYPLYAMQAIFYQPQLRDMAVSEARWAEVLVYARDQGFDTLVVQWTKFGQAFTSQEEADWLQRRLEQVRTTGLNLVVGLYADPDFFQRQKQSVGNLGHYLDQTNIENFSLARAWLDRLGAEAISGWYLPTEMDDANWRSNTRQRVAEKYLQNALGGLNKIAPYPVYVTSFFTGKMTPAAYRDMLRRFSDTGVHVWVQTGEGTGVLSGTERQLYLDGLLPCEGVVQGLVREIFMMERQQIPGETGFKTLFQAVPEAQQAVMRSEPSMCGSDRVFFSLRYLPDIKDMR